MKYLLLIGIIAVANVAVAQNYGTQTGGGFTPADVGYNLDRLVSSSLASPSQEAAVINAQADYVYKSSLANINNEKAYAIHLNNDAMRASTYFEKRQINRYNRALEELQQREIARMRRSGVFSKDDLDQLFDVRYKTGYITP